MSRYSVSNAAKQVQTCKHSGKDGSTEMNFEKVQILGGQTRIMSRYLPSYFMGMENGLIYATTLRSFLNWTKKSVIKSTNGVQSKDSVDCRSPYLLFHALQDEHPRAGRETSFFFFFF